MNNNLELNDIEKKILHRFLLMKQIGVNDENTFFSNLLLKSRELTGTGFISDLNKSELLKIDDEDVSYKWGKIGALLNSSVDSGYLLYIKNGYIVAIEGYTYADDWPDFLSEVELYEIKAGE